jgi:hypothetical protein
MSLVQVSQLNIPLIAFNSDDWGDEYDDDDIAEEIIKIFKNGKYKSILIQNKAYSFGDTEVPPIIKVNSNDFGGFKGTLSDFIKDIIYDLIQEKE